MSRHCIAIILGTTAAAAVAWSVIRTPEIPFEKHTARSGVERNLRRRRYQRRRQAGYRLRRELVRRPALDQAPLPQLSYTNNYIDNFSDLPLDVNGDGHIDIVSCSWFTKRLWWMRESRHAAAASGKSTRSRPASRSSLRFWWIWIMTARRAKCCRNSARRSAAGLVRGEGRRVREARGQPAKATGTASARAT